MRARKPRHPGGPPLPLEWQLQTGPVDWLRLARPRCMYFHVPNEGARTKSEAARLQRMGVVAGVPDLVFMGMPNCQVALIELKVAGGSLSPEQVAFAARCNDVDVPVHVIATDDTAELIEAVRSRLVGWGALS